MYVKIKCQFYFKISCTCDLYLWLYQYWVKSENEVFWADIELSEAPWF